MTDTDLVIPHHESSGDLRAVFPRTQKLPVPAASDGRRGARIEPQAGAFSWVVSGPAGAGDKVMWRGGYSAASRSRLGVLP